MGNLVSFVDSVTGIRWKFADIIENIQDLNTFHEWGVGLNVYYKTQIEIADGIREWMNWVIESINWKSLSAVRILYGKFHFES